MDWFVAGMVGVKDEEVSRAEYNLVVYSYTAT